MKRMSVQSQEESIAILNKSSISVVIPCLNEESTLPFVLEKLEKLRSTELRDRSVEVIVSDNGSHDRSIEIAQRYGAKVVHCKERGYGAALKFGIVHASNEVVVFADADNTYDFLDVPRLVEKVDDGFDLAIGSRIRGKIEPGAMPWLHRYVGTPLLNFLINSLYSNWHTQITDCNSGFRAFKKETFLAWNVQSAGMEFASEMLVKALTVKARIGEVPITLSSPNMKRTPHLKTWRDGMRHLLQILLEAPNFFYSTGLILFISSWLIISISLGFKGSVSVGFASIFGIHTTSIGLLGSFFGLTTWGIGLFLAAKKKTNIKVYNDLINLPEDKLFWIVVLFLILSALMLIFVFGVWASHHFRILSLEKEIIAMSAFIVNGLLMVSNLITAHLIKRT